MNEQPQDRNDAVRAALAAMSPDDRRATLDEAFAVAAAVMGDLRRGSSCWSGLPDGWQPMRFEFSRRALTAGLDGDPAAAVWRALAATFALDDAFRAIVAGVDINDAD